MSMARNGKALEKLEKLEKPKAEANSRLNLKQGPRSGDSPDREMRGDTRDLVGRAVGTGGKRYEQAKKVVEAQEDEDPAVRRVAREAVNEAGKRFGVSR